MVSNENVLNGMKLLDQLGTKIIANPLSSTGNADFSKLIKTYHAETIREIIVTNVCKKMSLTLEQLSINTRKREIVNTRQMIFYFQIVFLKYRITLKQMGDIFTNKAYDHATVLHGHKVIGNWYDTDKYIKLIIDDIKENINLEIIADPLLDINLNKL